MKTVKWIIIALVGLAVVAMSWESISRGEFPPMKGKTLSDAKAASDVQTNRETETNIEVVIESVFREIELGNRADALAFLAQLGRPGKLAIIKQLNNPKRSREARIALHGMLSADLDLVEAAHSGDAEIRRFAREVLDRNTATAERVEYVGEQLVEVRRTATLASAKAAVNAAEISRIKEGNLPSSGQTKAAPVPPIRDDSAELDDKRDRLQDRISWLQREIRNMNYNILCEQKVVSSNSGGRVPPETMACWRDNIAGYRGDLQRLNAQLSRAQAELKRLPS